jgi:hypothetical protein
MADGTLKVGTITTSSGSGTITLGQSGETITSSATMGNGMGKVLQVVNSTFSTQVSSTSNTFADTGLSASITPSSSSSKILIFVNINGIYKITNNTGISLKLVRGSTDIHNIESLAGYTDNTNSNAVGSASTSYLDSPSTTSSTTYKITFNSFNNNATVSINANSVSAGSVSTITLMEIAG